MWDTGLDVKQKRGIGEGKWWNSNKDCSLANSTVPMLISWFWKLHKGYTNTIILSYTGKGNSIKCIHDNSLIFLQLLSKSKIMSKIRYWNGKKYYFEFPIRQRKEGNKIVSCSLLRKRINSWEGNIFQAHDFKITL